MKNSINSFLKKISRTSSCDTTMSKNKPSSKFLFIYISFIHQTFVFGLIAICALLNLVNFLYLRSLSLIDVCQVESNENGEESCEEELNSNNNNRMCLIRRFLCKKQSDLSISIKKKRKSASKNALNLMLTATNLNDWCYGFTLLLFIHPKIPYIFIIKASNICQVLTHALNFFIFLFFHTQFRKSTRGLLRKVRN